MSKKDPAAYFVVTDVRGTGSRIDYFVEGFAIDGSSLLKTWHIGETSMRIECEAWRSRGAVEHKQ